MNSTEPDGRSEPERNEDDYSVCPIPTTHRRLAEAHLLWHQALVSYPNPDRFRANLNATIQALRNVTFAVQSEKGAFADFDTWYAPWQQRLAADSLAAWVKNSRNRIVKQGELETSSTAVVRLLTWKDELLTEIQAPPEAPSHLIFANIPLLRLIADANVPPGDAASAAVAIERRWSIPELKGREALDALAQAYGLLSELVLDAHVHLGRSHCIAPTAEHSHFVSRHHRTGVLECMAVGAESRTERFTVAGDSIGMESATRPSRVTPSQAASRYGLTRDDLVAEWELSDPVLLAERVLFQAKRILRRDRHHIRMVFIRDGASRWHQLNVLARDRTEKHILLRMLASFVESVGADAIIDVGEVWTLDPERLGLLSTPLSSRGLESVPGREEALQVLVATREGLLRTFHTPFKRGVLGGIKLADTVTFDKQQPYYLQPIVDVWLKQGRTKDKEGQDVRRLWEADALDLCFCGSSRRYSDCCQPVHARHDGGPIPQTAGEGSMETQDTEEAERRARAALSQYVLWVKRHTAPARHVADDLHRKIVDLDVPALEAHIRQFGEALDANGRLGELPAHLHHISSVIGVPELSVRVIALAASHALDSGDGSGAVAELERLGDLDKIRDTLALLVAARLFAGDPRDERRFLDAAVACARDDAERGFAELHLSRCMAERGERAKALLLLDQLLGRIGTAPGMEGLRSDALVEKWEITGTDRDFAAAKTALEMLSDIGHRRDLAVLLMNHGDLSAADTVLATFPSNDALAGVLRVEILLRSDRRNEAKEALGEIHEEHVPGKLLHPYAHAIALVALATNDDALKRRALTKLSEVRSAGRQAALVDEMIEALRRSIPKS